MTQKCPNKIQLKFPNFNQKQKFVGFFPKGGGKTENENKKRTEKKNHAQLASGKFDYLPLPVHPLHRQC